MAQTTPKSGNGVPQKSPSKNRRIMVVVAIVVVIVVGASLAVFWYRWENNQGQSQSQCPCIIPMSGGTPVPMECGTTPGALFFEPVTLTPITGTITTNMLGLRVIPTAGGEAVKNVAPPASGSPCPANGGFYASLNNSAGTAVACWAGVLVGGSPAWSSPTSGICANPNGAPLGSPITLTGSDTLGVYMYGSVYPGVPPMAGDFTLDAYGINGYSVSGSFVL